MVKVKIRNILILVFAVLSVSLLAGWYLFIKPERYASTIVLKGAVVTPGEIIDPGWIVVRKGKIVRVSSVQPDVSNAITLDTEGLIFPGLIDIHNHITWNMIPRWDPDEYFLNRYEWRDGDEHSLEVREVRSDVGAEIPCEINEYGEIRALIGGTTSTMGSGGKYCIRGLVRNLDRYSDFYLIPMYQDDDHIRYVIDLPSDPSDLTDFLNDPVSEAFFIHLAEGIGPAMQAEFEQLDDMGLLTDKTIIIHGVALTPDQFRRMGEAGASLVWSPRSNLELYGTTTAIDSAINAGVEIAIGPDWAITGSATLLDELRLADDWNATHLDGFLSDEQLVNMVTINPAEMAGISEFVGQISEGRYADLLVISGDSSQPYSALIDALPSDIQLVMVNGIPLYGDRTMMAQFWDSDELSSMDVMGTPKAIRVSDLPQLISDVENELAKYGFGIAPIVETEGYEIPDTLIEYIPGSTPQVGAEGIQWNEAIYFFGEEMTVCGPVVDLAYADSDDEIPSNLYLGRSYPDIDRFNIFIPWNVRDDFLDISRDYYLDKEVCVTGTIEPYRGTAEIAVHNPDQLIVP